MKKFVIIIFFFLANSILIGQIKINIATDKTEYQFRDSIKIYVTAINTTGQSITLNWNTTCQAGYQIINVYKLVNDTSCYEVLTSLTLVSGESHTWTFTHNNIGSGHYQIFGEVYGYGFSDTTEIEIIEKDFSYYSATVKNSNNLPIKDVIVISAGAAQVMTNAEGKFTTEYPPTIFPDGFITIPTAIQYYHPDYGYYNDTILISKGDSIVGPDVILTNLISVTGNIKFDNNEPAQNCYVYFFNSTNQYIAVSDMVGNYVMQCIPGFYYAGASMDYHHGDTWTYRIKYYNDKTELADAELIEVNNQTKDIDFTFPYLNLGTISGRIIDSETQQPLSNVWISVESVLPSDSTFSGTDENGNYTVEVYEGSYHLWAYKSGYYKQFYKNAYNTFDALPITVSKDSLNIQGIDISLIKPQPGSNTISGFVVDKNSSTASYGVEVYAIPVNDGNWNGSTTGFDGAYFLKDLKDGDYVLLFYKENCISQFYKNHSETCNEWEDAYIFKLNGGEHISFLYTYLEPINSMGGQILGNIYYNNSDSTISGSLITAIDSAGNTISSSISVYNGSYLIPSLKNSSYTIKASKIGYQSSEYSEKINIDLNNKPVINGVNIYFTLTDAKENTRIAPEFYKLTQNYPNPFNPSTKIRYSIPINVGSRHASTVQLKVYDILGNEVAALVNEEQNPGNYEVTFDTQDLRLSSGIYFYQLKVNDFIASKKMLLLK